MESSGSDEGGSPGMRCVHCSSVVERNDWFCPNCRRSPRLALDLRPKRRPVWGMYAACIAMTAALTTAGTVFGMRFWHSPAPAAGGYPDDRATVSVRELAREAPANPADE